MSLSFWELLFENPFEGRGLPEFVEKLGSFGSLTLLAFTAVIIVSLYSVWKILKGSRPRGTGEIEERPGIIIRARSDYEASPREASPREIFPREADREPAPPAESYASTRASLPMNFPMHLQIMLEGEKFPEQRIFYIRIPEGGQSMTLRQLLRDRAWAEGVDFKEMTVRRAAGSGLLELKTRGWIEWKPLKDVRCVQSDGSVIQFRYVR